MTKVFFMMALLFAALLALPADAQQTAWVQIESRPDLNSAQAQARVYAATLPDLNGFRTTSGWYVLVLGPYSPGKAATRLAVLKGQRRLPSDAFVTDGSGFGSRFWPAGGTVPAEAAQAPAAGATTAAPAQPQESLSDARRSERALTRDARMLVQRALSWEGDYKAGIDGDFGYGTRAAMRAYQLSIGAAPTGVLTTQQRRTLVSGYQTAIATLAMKPVRDEEAGIEVEMPTGLVKFDSYDPPFAKYLAKSGSGVQVLLISQPGGKAELSALYDLIQTLKIVPPEGKRQKSASSFVIDGKNATLHSLSYAATRRGLIKGFMLVWPIGKDRLMTKAARLMRKSFKPFGNFALDESLGLPGTRQGIDLLSGLEIRRPAHSRSGVFVDSKGDVLTSAEAVSGCNRITLGDNGEAKVAFRDEALAIAVLKPVRALQPIGYARFITTLPRLAARVAVAGYSYGGILGAPTLSFGRIEALTGLDGAQDVERLSVRTRPGDTGGAVLDERSALVGLLLPRRDTDRQLPKDVAFAARADSIVTAISSAGIAITRSEGGPALPPEELTRKAQDMTVLVSCWK